MDCSEKNLPENMHRSLARICYWRAPHLEVRLLQLHQDEKPTVKQEACHLNYTTQALAGAPISCHSS